MDDTLMVSYRWHLFRSSSTRPVSALAARVPRWGCLGGPSWDCRLPDNAFFAIALPGSSFRPLQQRAFPAVAYSSGIQSRLGYSPNGVFDAAYHTTTGKSRSKTNNSPGQKIRTFSPLPVLPAPLRLPRLRRVPETITGQYRGDRPEGWLSSDLPLPSSSNLVNQKRGLNICRT